MSKYNYTNYDPNLQKLARDLRNNMTKQEKRLWYEFLKTYPVRFYRQRPICGYIVDFYCAKAKLIIELDGSQHFTEDGLEYDEMRSDLLEELGLEVIRYTNPQTDKEFESVCMGIDRKVKEKLAE